MAKTRILLGTVVGVSLISTAAVAQTTQTSPPRPVRPQPPRPPKPVKPRPPRPPRPVKPRPPKPVPARPPITVNPGWGHGHIGWGHLHPGWAYGRAVLFTGPNYSGRWFTVTGSVSDLRRYGFNDVAHSFHARGRWQLCSAAHYRGTCVTMHNSDPYLRRLGGRVSSVRYLGH